MTRASSPDQRLSKLNSVLSGAKSMLIAMQNNPDPDAIAAAAALREIANEIHGISCSVAHGGTVGRAENQALLRYLGLNPRALESLDRERFDRLAIVDAQPGAGNVAVPRDTRFDIVIDHHPIRRGTRAARFTDIRSRYGATSSMLFEYLQAAGIEPPPPLATAMVYGIRSDTQDLGRETTQADINAFLALYPRANPRALGRIVSARLPRSYFAKLRTALDRATLHGTRVVSFLGTLDSPDMVAEAADLLLRIEDVTWSMCMGIVDGCLHVSLRTMEREGEAGTVARHLAGRKGAGGGHGALAAAQIPLTGDDQDPARLKRLVTALTRRFLRATGGFSTEVGALCDCATS